MNFAMRKLLLFAACIMFAVSLQAQTILRSQSHGLVADQINEMKITNYTEPGTKGNNVVWDFRSLELTRDFVGSLDVPTFSKGALLFKDANTLLEEFGNHFFFKTTETSIEQHGFMTGSGNVAIVYDEPFVKMKYPFAYGSHFVGSFSGRYLSNDRQLATIQGSYAVEGDGQGTLMLPGNMVYEGALRVKEVKSYTQKFGTQPHDVETITYRWYVNGHRFPILVLIASTTTYENGRSHTSTQAAYNAVALEGDQAANPLDVNTLAGNVRFDAYPNPYQYQVSIRFNLEQDSNVNLSVYDVNGRLVKGGDKLFTFSAKEMGLAGGLYIVKLNVNGAETSKRILEL